ncbi:hypothetical protein [Microbispora bryophytorum]|uniref:hypothetical protein n=1 Tax=Microbispora bryophytorum TaxID=1460882 RepID=UPI00340A3AF3
MTRDSESGGDGLSGNVFHGPAPFQLGDRNVQINHIHQAPPQRRPLVLAGAAVTTREELAAAVRGDWTAARRQFFEGVATTGAPSDGWLSLLTWLHELDGLTADDLTAQIELIDHRLRDDALPADLKLLHLLGWLDPAGEAVWRGTVVSPESLSEALRIGRLRDSGPERELYRDLCAGGLLDALAGFTVLSALRGIQQTWDEVWDSWRQLAARVPGLPPEAREWAGSGARGLLLAALLPYSESRAWVRAGCESVAPPPPGEIEWYDWLRARDGGSDTPVGWLVRADFTAFAAAQAEQLRRQAAVDRQNQRMSTMLDATSALRERQWADYERRRLSPIARLEAAVRAALWLGAWGAATIPVAWIVWGWARPDIAVLLAPLLAVAFHIARIGALHDWADDHQERLRDHRSRRAGSGGVPQSIARGVRSPSARVRADAYQAYLRQFTGLDHGGQDEADRENGRR